MDHKRKSELPLWDPYWQKKPKQEATDFQEFQGALVRALADGKSFFIPTDGKAKVIDKAVWGLRELYVQLECDRVEFVPLTIGVLRGMGTLMCDEEGMGTQLLNKAAMDLVGDQVHGGTLYGSILLVPPEQSEQEEEGNTTDETVLVSSESEEEVSASVVGAVPAMI